MSVVPRDADGNGWKNKSLAIFFSGHGVARDVSSGEEETYGQVAFI